MNKNSINRYFKLQKKLSASRDNNVLELLFIVWAYLSTDNNMYHLPEEFHLKNWSNRTFHGRYDKAELGYVFNGIDKYLPQLKGTFKKIYSQVLDHPVFIETQLHFAGLFRELLYENFSTEDWKEIFEKAYSNYVKRFSYSENDPTEICELMSKLFSKLNSESINNSVLIPFLRGGEMAVVLNKTTDGKYRIIGKEQNSEIFNICVLYCFIHGIDTAEFDLASFDQLLDLKNAFPLLAIFPTGFYREDDLYSSLLRKTFSDNAVSVIMVPQNLFFAKKFDNLRKWMILDGFLSAIISIPPIATLYSRARMALMVFDKKRIKDKILMVNAEGINKENKRQPGLTKEQVSYLVNITIGNEEQPGFSKLVRISEFMDKGFQINMNVLVPEEKKLYVPTRQRMQTIIDKQNKLLDMEQKVQQYLKELFHTIN